MKAGHPINNLSLLTGYALTLGMACLNFSENISTKGIQESRGNAAAGHKDFGGNLFFTKEPIA